VKLWWSALVIPAPFFDVVLGRVRQPSLRVRWTTSKYKMVVDVAEKYHDCDTASLLQMIGTFFVAPWKTAVRSLNREKMHQMDQENAIELTGIADMLIKLTQFNDRIPLASSNLTRFHSRQIPPITVAEYLQRCVKYAALERTTLIMLLVYIDRVCERHRMFVISSLTVHRYACF